MVALFSIWIDRNFLHVLCNFPNPFSTYLVGNPSVLPHQSSLPLSCKVFVFRRNRTMYIRVQVHVQSILPLPLSTLMIWCGGNVKIFYKDVTCPLNPYLNMYLESMTKNQQVWFLKYFLSRFLVSAFNSIHVYYSEFFFFLQSSLVRYINLLAKV
jgi:hypothetical protein